MTLDDLKRELVEHMEEAHGKRYHRNFFGCLTAIIIDSGPVTQERIMELTGYSKASVSLALQKIQLILPVRTVKKMGDRKYYYEYRGSPQEFLIDIMYRRTDMPDIDVQMIRTMEKKVEKKLCEHDLYRRFRDYLAELSLYLKLMHSIRKENLSTYRRVLLSGSFDGVNLPEASVLHSDEIQDFIRVIRATKSQDETAYDHVEKNPPPDYLTVKRDYFRNIKTGLNPLFAQSVANLVIVVHDVIIEKVTTQEMLEESTQLPRSTISDVLSLAVDQGFIDVERSTVSRKKVYRSAVSLLEVILMYYDRGFAYAAHTRKKILSLIKRMSDISSHDSDYSQFLKKLHTLEKAYALTEEFTTRAKVAFIQELMNTRKD
jgi:DNA-binding transcriptional regulator GbsR (MarR family)